MKKKTLWIFSLKVEIWQESSTHNYLLTLKQEFYNQYKISICAAAFNSDRKFSFYKITKLKLNFIGTVFVKRHLRINYVGILSN